MNSLKAEQARLVQRQSELAGQRRESISKRAERCAVLEIEDDPLTGPLRELKAAIVNGILWVSPKGVTRVFGFGMSKIGMAKRHKCCAAPGWRLSGTKCGGLV